MIPYTLLAVALLAVVIFAVYRKLNPATQGPAEADLPLEISSEPDQPVPFGYKTCWLAVRASHPQEVIDALGLREVQPANWLTGTGATLRQGQPWAFVTPAIDGWVLVVDRTLPTPGDGTTDWELLMEPLAARFAEVQFFGNHRVSDFVGWGLYRNGKCLRSYRFVAETIYSHGKRTAEEKALGIPTPAIGDVEGDVPDEESVMQLAGAWSVDPSRLDERAAHLGLGCGWLGRRP